MAFIVKTNKGYVKRTAKFGPFYGNIVLTENKDDALRFSKQADAETRASVVEWRTRIADPSATRWDNNEGYDRKKFGTLTAEVEEI